MSKRSHGDGTLFKRKDGRWQGSLQVDGKRRTVYGKTEREARAKLRELQREAESGSSPQPASGHHTVNELLDAWVENAPNLKPSTIAKNRWFLDTHIRPTIGNLRLDKVTPDRLQSLYTDLTPSMAEKIHRLLHRAFTVAVMWGWLSSNPCDRVLKPAYKAQQKTMWTRAELDNFISGTAEHWLNPIWVLLIATGCRIGEALALAWDDVNLDAGVMSISRTLHRIDDEWVLDSAKTDSSVRTIALPEIAVDALRRQKQQQACWKEAAGSTWADWGLVFTGETGLPSVCQYHPTCTQT